ncbi:hypothetical protein [Parasphingorhabdus sp.]|uniref:hypothetical protein n=1 Tax=Parasphingorhabdus sp. TaxID=2709688 RepID=UPI002F93A0C6
MLEAPDMFEAEILEESVTDMNELAAGDMWGGQILLVSDDSHLRALYSHAIELLGGRCALLNMNFKSDDLSQRMNVAAVIVQVSEWNEDRQAALRTAEQYCETSGLPLLIRTDLDLLDAVLGAVTYEHVEHLLSDNIAELYVALEHRTRQYAGTMFADRDEIDLTDLKKISADVERIARALVKLSGPEHAGMDRPLIANPFQEPDSGSQLHDPSAGYIAMPSLDNMRIGKPIDITPQSDSPSRPVTADEVRGLIKARRLRDQYFDAELFADPAWDMLLDLMAARLEGIEVAVSSLCIAASVPPTTALRWIKTMTEERIFIRRADERDGRRIFIELSDDATAAMVGYFAMIRRSGLMMV